MKTLSHSMGMIFCFSSRRRHTRCSRDWSSDVCSSDLHSADFDSWSRARRTCKKGRGIAPSPSDHEQRCFFECFALDAHDTADAQEPFEVAQRHGISHCDCRGADHRAAIHHGDNSPERISRNPGGCSTAALGTAPGPCGRYSRSAYHAPKGKVELHAATTDGTYCDSEDRIRRLR